MTFFLIPLAIILVVIVSIPSLLVKIFTDPKGLRKYFKQIAVGIDQTGNVSCAPLLNIVLIKKTSVHKFGNPDETVSGVLGKNKKSGTLTWLGRRIAWRLNKIEKDHVENSVEDDEK